jgi:hypothetical protein
MNVLDVKLCRMIGHIDGDFRKRAAERVAENVCKGERGCVQILCGKLCDVAEHDVEMLRRGFWWEFCRWN